MKWFNYIIIFPIRVYQIFISPILGKNCRFNPTCSNYMIQAVNEWGIFYGVFLGIRRITKCHPWGGSGDDPIPKKKK
ncbi:MAG: membrane protein insertion efficiency factor YidD [Saprospiraceae bacterium]|nr:membrane protein insertion efficiency factor YidD [Candidatus Defluviibacterium haderslevense]HRI35479.1 membrane protein insertion efficiency factor YidD [Saprospiraceae bacterium]